jgi:hypothetical protein
MRLPLARRYYQSCPQADRTAFYRALQLGSGPSQESTLLSDGRQDHQQARSIESIDYRPSRQALSRLSKGLRSSIAGQFNIAFSVDGMTCALTLDAHGSLPIGVASRLVGD